MKKGFTLIELLAVIVILAIISLIAIPIVLNIIEDARKSSIADSAYGYKDAITKFFAGELISNSEFDIADITYTVSNGSLQYIDSEDSNNNVTYNIEMNGQRPTSGSVEVINRAVVNACLEYDNYAVTIVNGSVKEVVVGSCDGLVISNGVFSAQIYDFDYVQNGSNKEQTFEVPKTGYYKLEVWGAQGGNYKATDRNGYSTDKTGGYGGYSTGIIRLTEGTTLYINVGGQGESVYAERYSFNSQGLSGGYNGGGSGGTGYSGNYPGGAGGGGATHIATSSGLLSELNSNRDSVIIVAGAGGGGGWVSDGGSAGGYIGKSTTGTRVSTGGTQDNGYAFGQGSNGSKGYGLSGSSEGSSGSGAGWYGGITFGDEQVTNKSVGGGGGSSYIGNQSLIDAFMVCHNCTTSTDPGLTTISVTEAATTPTSYYAKAGNGHARITYVGNNINSVGEGYKIYFSYTGEPNEYTVKKSGYYKLEVWGGQGGSYNNNYKGGYGSYSTGKVYLAANQKLYVYVGGQGISGLTGTLAGGYNGGGNGYGGNCNGGSNRYGASGGGATHIALQDGLLSSFDANENGLADSDETNNILIVAAGGGGSHYMNSAYGSGAAAGGYIGNTATWTNSGHSYYVQPTGGTQTSGGSIGYSYSTRTITYATFGKGQNYPGSNCGEGSGGGGGYYGGGAGAFAPGAGGSGYIGNSSLDDKVMFCYGCSENDNTGTKTISTTGSSELRDTTNCSDGFSSAPIGKCAKTGNGYAIITYLGSSLQ